MKQPPGNPGRFTTDAEATIHGALLIAMDAEKFENLEGRISRSYIPLRVAVVK